MRARNAVAFSWADWLADRAVRRLTPAERGVWIDLLALATLGRPKGYVCDAKGRPLGLEQIARITNAESPDELAKHIDGIVQNGAASRDQTGRLFNERMVRTAQLSAKRRAAGAKGGTKTQMIWKDFQSRPRPMPGPSPQDASRAGETTRADASAPSAPDRRRLSAANGGGEG
jgi:hypothetical protein